MSLSLALWIAFKTALVCLAIIGAFAVLVGVIVLWRTRSILQQADGDEPHLIAEDWPTHPRDRQKERP